MECTDKHKRKTKPKHRLQLYAPGNHPSSLSGLTRPCTSEVRTHVALSRCQRQCRETRLLSVSTSPVCPSVCLCLGLSPGAHSRPTLSTSHCSDARALAGGQRGQNSLSQLLLLAPWAAAAPPGADSGPMAPSRLRDPPPPLPRSPSTSPARVPAEPRRPPRPPTASNQGPETGTVRGPPRRERPTALVRMLGTRERTSVPA